MTSRRKFIKSASLLTLSNILPVQSVLAAPQTIVGVIYVGARSDFGYSQAQASAVNVIKKMPHVKVVEQESVPETIAVQKAIEAMIVQDGATLIFATSFGYFDPHVLKMAAKYPQVRFAHCGGLWKRGNPSNIASYFGHIDEYQYLNGVVAGHMTQSKKLGFVAAKPISQVLRNINAFTLGAQSVDPSIKTQVIFTGDWSLLVKEAEATNSLIDQGCDVLTCQVDGPKVVVGTAEKRGVMSCGFHASQAALAPQGYLTGAEWDWATPYTQLLSAAQSGAPQPNILRGGLKEKYVKMAPYGPKVSASAKQNADSIKRSMEAGNFVIFEGPMKDNKGATAIAAGVSHVQSDRILESMNYLVAGVVG
ncbi:BMP family ABC transporter substrate-binding protein [Collimonas sp.]|jgi:basic membrane protein A|uniref:BMP family ABC transporter substrate-binding protein n=1 Tax=Collimonas sp. TaxID=1963772 RepID=UPI0037BF3F1D